MELTVITGMSGAGKSQAMGAFEDSGWFVVDNLPPKLLSSLAQLFAADEERVDRAAVVCDIRGGVFFDDLGAEMDRMEQATGTRPRVLFLEASDQVLLNRYRETRRRHPLAEDAPVIEGIRRERQVLRPVRNIADVIIDTSDLNIWDLRRRIIESMIDPDARPGMQVLFTSFGFKHGTPNDADLLFDVRFISNPHYVPEFAPKTGLDPEVAAFVRDAPETAGFVPRLESMLDFLLPAYAEEGKSHVVVAFGCTGGRHRSVYMAERMATRYRGRPEFQVSVTHRDLSRATLKAREDADTTGRAS